MLKKQEILAVYQKGPQAICNFIHDLENQIQDLKGRIEELENHSKKNSQNSHKPPSTDVCVNQLQKVYANHPSVQPVASWATKGIPFI
ncbi:DUF6444 domain-containing protein [Bacillus thuringiensis]